MNLLRISQYIQRFIFTYVTVFPGFYRKRKLKILREFLREVVLFLDKCEVEYWLDFGTLLGYYRENDVIPHDIDIDVALMEGDYEKMKKMEHLLPTALKMYDTSKNHHGPKLYLSYKGYDTDLYFYEDLGEHIRSYEVAHCPNERQEIPKSLLLPIKESDLLGLKIKTPAKTKEYLEFIYGYIGRDAVRNMKTGFWEKKA